ncbi:hypothetical protein [uncultured Methanobrevibacter sp.]|uniref:hypothetical protein n=1 Tax=uncultured Methanobrevibacter sp. TaxID=253161 RepID=UPI0025DB80D2|nr:hypothetical protein [uncultured Methanobrevibacter sp.]
MDNKQIIIMLVVVVVILTAILSFTLLTSYKTVDENYIVAPLPNEKVMFTGTYLGPDDSIYNSNGNSGVIQVGNSYVLVSTAKLQGMENQTVTVKGYFVNDMTDRDTVPINNMYVNGDHFRIEEVVNN